jgi:cysteine desulfurase / selenocysteine lyase
MIDVAAVRRETPGCQGVAHLNNAGAGLLTLATLDVVNGYLKLEAALGGYEAHDAAMAAFGSVRSSAARLVNATPEEIALTTSDSHAFTKAFWGLVLDGWFSSGDLVVVDRLSYNSHHYALLQAAQLIGIRLDVLDDLSAVPDNARMVAFTLIGTHSGRVRDLSGVSEQTRTLGIPFFVDACQAVGQRVVDVQTLGCDVLTTTGRKWLRGPRGTGFMFVRSPWITRMQPPGIDGVAATWTSLESFALMSDARRFEEFETSFAARLGLGSAIEQALELGIDNIAERVDHLGAVLRSELDALGTVTLHDGDGDRSGIVTFTVDGHQPESLRDRAAAAGINVSVSNGPWIETASKNQFLSAVVRASPHYYNTVDELDQLVDLVARLR